MHSAVKDRAEPELRRQLEPAPDVTLTTTEVGSVDGDYECLVPGGRSAVDHVAQQALVLPDVDLEPPVTVSVDGCHLLDRPCRERRQGVRQASPVGGSSDGQLTLGIGDPRESGRREHERQRNRLAHQARSGIDVRDIAEHSRPEPIVAERCPVGAHRPLVLGTAVDVVEHSTRKPSLGDPAQIIDTRRRGQPALVGIELESPEADDGAQRVEHRGEMLRRCSRRGGAGPVVHPDLLPAGLTGGHRLVVHVRDVHEAEASRNRRTADVGDVAANLDPGDPIEGERGLP